MVVEGGGKGGEGLLLFSFLYVGVVLFVWFVVMFYHLFAHRSSSFISLSVIITKLLQLSEQEGPTPCERARVCLCVRVYTHTPSNFCLCLFPFPALYFSLLSLPHSSEILSWQSLRAKTGTSGTEFKISREARLFPTLNGTAYERLRSHFMEGFIERHMLIITLGPYVIYGTLHFCLSHLLSLFPYLSCLTLYITKVHL